MVNPPRDEMRKIRAQLQEYGQVGDANVFYWFQNRKLRKKQKQQERHLQSSQQSPQIPLITSSSSSSSSEKSSQNSGDQKTLSPLGPKNFWNNASSSPTSSVNQSLFQTHTEFLPILFLFPVQSTSTPVDNQWSNSFTDATNDNAIQYSSSLLFSDLLLMNHFQTKKVEVEKVKLQQQINYTASTTPPCTTTTQSIFSPTTISALSSNNHHIQGAS